MPPEEKWAAGVCTVISSWKQEMLETVIKPTQRVRPAPGSGTRITVFETIAKEGLLLRELEAEAKRLDPPTDGARRAQEVLVGNARAVGSYYFDTVLRSFEQDFRKLGHKPTTSEKARMLAKLDHNLRTTYRQIDALTIGQMVVIEPSVGGSFLNADTCDEFRKDPNPG